MQDWLEDPLSLQNLLTALAPAHTRPLGQESADLRLNEEDVVSFVRLLTQVTRASRQVKDDKEAAELGEFFRQQFQGLPPDLLVALEGILATMAAGEPGARPLAIELVVRLTQAMAVDAYCRGQLSPTGIRALLRRMTAELSALRRSLGQPPVEFDDTELEEEFWSSLPEPERQRVLTSADAWCVPPRVLRQVAEKLREEPERVRALLEHYAFCAHHELEEARIRAAHALTELADVYAGLGQPLLESAIAHVGHRLGCESRPELRSLFGNAFTRLTQQAAAGRGFRALEQALGSLRSLERSQPLRGEELRARVAVEGRLADYLHEAAATPEVGRELLGFLQQVPEAATEELNRVFESCPHREGRHRLAELAAGLGAVAVERLREKLRSAPPLAAVSTVGLLSQLQPSVLDELIPARLARWGREYHDAVVQGLAAAGATDRGKLLLRLLAYLDPLVIPGALDEIGMSGDPEAAPRLMRLAGGTLLQSSEPFLRVKAVEALGRLRDPSAVPLLRQIVESKAVWRWSEPRELRIAAAQALKKIDPEWSRKSLQRSGLTPAELALGPLDSQSTTSWVRQRRYPRIPLGAKMPMRVKSLRGLWSLQTQVLSLGGGLAESQAPVPAGAQVEVELLSGLRPVRAVAVVRDPRPSQLGFEIVGMDLGERAKLRQLLVPHWQQADRGGAPAR